MKEAYIEDPDVSLLLLLCLSFSQRTSKEKRKNETKIDVGKELSREIVHLRRFATSGPLGLEPNSFRDPLVETFLLSFLR